MKKVVSQQDVAHLFANQLQSEARNTNNSFYFYEDKIYSYGSHFCIAKFVDENTLLFTERTYSSTTSGHIAIVRSATSHKAKIYCAFPTGSHEDNFKYWLNDAEAVTKQLQNARKPEIYLTQLNGIKDRVQKYANYFNISVPITLNEVLSVTNKDEVKSYLESKQKYIDAENKRKEKEQIKKHRKDLKLWRSFEKQKLYSRDGFDYLRKDSENFETTQGVKFPIAVGMRFYNNLTAVKVGDKFLNYEVKEVTKNHIVIGCHKITMKEINSVI